jgi:two-component system CheB/CheR fusion protein
VDAYVCKGDGPDALLNRISTLLPLQRVELSPAADLALEGEQRYRVIMETISDAVIAIDQHSRILFANSASKKIFGYADNELLGEELTLLMPHYQRQQHRETLERHITTGEQHGAWQGVKPVGLHKDGHEIPVEISFSEYAKDGKRMFVGIIRDISERKQAEREHAQLAAIVESSNDAIIGETLDGIVTAWNKGAERMFGYAAEEIMGKPASILLPQEKLQEESQILSLIRRGEGMSVHDSIRVTKDGRVLTVGVTISPIYDAYGAVTGASTIARDLTHVKMAEQAVRNSEKLAVAGRLAATVAHEINGPLETVANILFLLERAELSHTAHEFVHAAQEEVKRIGQITKLTLGFHREGERGEAELRASDLIDGILALYGHRIESLGVAIEKRYDSAGALIADAGELRQVFSNLIVNAGEALAKKGDKLLIHVYDSPDWRGTGRKGVRITIADNGSGIPLEFRHKLFEPFFTTKGEKGTGLGLWVTKSLVDKQDGSLRVRSIPGIGTTFSIFLPSNLRHRPSPAVLPTPCGRQEAG